MAKAISYGACALPAVLCLPHNGFNGAIGSNVITAILQTFLMPADRAKGALTCRMWRNIIFAVEWHRRLPIIGSALANADIQEVVCADHVDRKCDHIENTILDDPDGQNR